MRSDVLPTFSSVRFSVVGFMLRSLIHLDLSFVHGDRYGSIFFLLHVDIQLWQHHLLNMLSFFYLIFFASLSNIRCLKMCGLIIWVFCLVPLVLLSVLMPVPGCFLCCSSVVAFEVRDCDASRSSFIAQDCFGNPRFFAFPNEIEYCSFEVCEEFCWELHWICRLLCQCILY